METKILCDFIQEKQGSINRIERLTDRKHARACPTESCRCYVDLLGIPLAQENMNEFQ